jgi:hypothetical protein
MPYDSAIALDRLVEFGVVDVAARVPWAGR